MNLGAVEKQTHLNLSRNCWKQTCFINSDFLFILSAMFVFVFWSVLICASHPLEKPLLYCQLIIILIFSSQIPNCMVKSSCTYHLKKSKIEYLPASSSCWQLLIPMPACSQARRDVSSPLHITLSKTIKPVPSPKLWWRRESETTTELVHWQVQMTWTN